MTRFAVAALSLGTAGPLVAVQWSDLSAERDAYRDEAVRLQGELDRRQDGMVMGLKRAEVGVSDFAGTPLMAGSERAVASAAEERLQLATQAAALRRELSDTRAQLASWERGEGDLDLAVGVPRGSSRRGSTDQLIDLRGDTEKLRRRLLQSDHDLEQVQVERDEALAQLRREMFSNLLYTTIIGECGQRNTPRGVAACSEQVRDTLRPQWGRFESCVRDYNAIPAYSQETSAQNVHNALRLSRGAVLMCDPGLP